MWFIVLIYSDNYTAYDQAYLRFFAPPGLLLKRGIGESNWWIFVFDSKVKKTICFSEWGR